MTENHKPVSDEQIASYSYLLSKEGLDSERVARQHALMQRQYKTEYDIVENDRSENASRSNEQGGGCADPMPPVRFVSNR